MGRLYNYELKKLLRNKLTLLTMGIVLLIVIAWGAFSAFAGAPREIDGDRPSRYIFNQMRQEESKKADGSVIDDTLLSQMNQYLPGSIGTKSFLQYYDIHEFVGFTIDTMSDVQISQTSTTELYDILREKLSVKYLTDERYSETEQAYWAEQAENILSAPITYNGYFDGWRQITNMIKVLVYLVVLFIAVCLSTIFTYENTRKTDQLIFASRYGKYRLYWAKISAGITVSVGFALLLIALFVGVVAVVFGLDGFDTMLQFVLMRPFDLSIGQAALILFGLLIVAALLTAVFVMVVSQFTQNSIATISIVAGMLMLSLFVSEVPGNIRWLSELWYLIPSNLINLNGAFRYSLLSVGNLHLVSWQYAFPAYMLLSVAFILAGRWMYGKYQIKAR